MKRVYQIGTLLFLAFLCSAYVQIQGSSGGSSFYQTLQDEAISLTQRATVNFTGAGVTCADNVGSNRTDCTVTGAAGAAYGTVQDEGTPLTQRSVLNCIGSLITCADDAINLVTKITLNAVNLASDVTGTLPVGNGGTGVATLTGLVKGNGAAAFTAYGGTSCTNQFLSALDASGVGTCTTPTLAGAQFANQGTTTTVLHGNAAGNPSFGAVSLTADVSGTLPVGNGGTGATTITGLVKGNGAAAMTAYAGTTCTQQVLTALDASGAGTCSNGVIVLARQVTTQTVNNTTTETTTFTYSVPANTLGSNRMIRVTTMGEVLRNTATSETFSWKFYYGGTRAGQCDVTIATETLVHGVNAIFTISAANATNAQVAQATCVYNAQTTFNPNGESAASTGKIGYHNAMTVDSTAAQNLEVRFQMSAADANASMILRTVQVELL